MVHDFKAYPELTNNQMNMYYFDSPHTQIAEDFWAKVVKVIDGDTIRVSVSWRDFDFPIRFNNIMAPELNENGGIASQKWLSSKLLGQEVEIQVDKNNRVGKYGRLLGKVMNSGFDIGEESKSLGHSIGVDEEKDMIKLMMELDL